MTPNHISPSEDRIQSDVMMHFHNNRPETRKCMWHVPNGGARNSIEGNRFKAMGVVAGIQDVHLIWKGKYHVIEFKTADGTVSPEQKEVHAVHAYHGFMTYIVRSAQEGIELISDILDGSSLESHTSKISPYADPEKVELYREEARRYRMIRRKAS